MRATTLEALILVDFLDIRRVKRRLINCGRFALCLLLLED